MWTASRQREPRTIVQQMGLPGGTRTTQHTHMHKHKMSSLSLSTQGKGPRREAHTNPQNNHNSSFTYMQRVLLQCMGPSGRQARGQQQGVNSSTAASPPTKKAAISQINGHLTSHSLPCIPVVYTGVKKGAATPPTKRTLSRHVLACCMLCWGVARCVGGCDHGGSNTTKPHNTAESVPQAVKPHACMYTLKSVSLFCHSAEIYQTKPNTVLLLYSSN